MACWLADRAGRFVYRGRFLRFALLGVDSRESEEYRVVLGSYLDDRGIDTVYITALADGTERAYDLFNSANANPNVSAEQSRHRIYCLPGDLADRMGIRRGLGPTVFVARLATPRTTRNPKDIIRYVHGREADPAAQADGPVGRSW